MAAKKTTKKDTTTVEVAEAKTKTPKVESKARLSRIRQMRNKKLIVALVLIAGLAGLLWFFRGQFIVATVNGKPITRLSVLQDLEARQGKQTVDNLVTESLIRQEAREQGIAVTTSDIDAEVEKLRTQFSSQGQDLEDLLDLQGMSMTDLRKQIELQKMLEQLLGDKTAVSDEEVQQYIEDNKDSFPEGQDISELTDSIKEELKNQKFSQTVQTYITDLKNKADINYWSSY